MTGRRLPIAVLLLALALVAFVAGDPDRVTVPRADDLRDATVVAPTTTRSTGWFCPGPPASIATDAEVLLLTNVGDEPETTVVTTYPDDATAPVVREVEVPARSVSRVPRAELGPAGGVVVEAFSHSVVVESGLVAPTALAANPCASTTATEWYVAAGTTARGVEQHLVIFNPLGTDAKVDVTLYTPNGPQPTDALTSLDVPRRSRVTVPIHEYAVRLDQVGVGVRAGIGRVVVEQSVVFGPDAPPVGVTRSLGVLAPSGSWTLATATSTTGTTGALALLNPGDATADVDVFATVGPDVVVDPVTATVPAGSVVWVQLGACAEPPSAACVAVPPDREFSLAVEASAGSEVVAELAARGGSTAGTGDAAVAATVSPARRWVVVYPHVDGVAASITVTNPGARPVEMEVEVSSRGRVERPRALARVVDAGQRVVFDAAEVAGADAAIAVVASGSVVVERLLVGADDVSRAPAIPVRDGR